ncbi:MAG: PEGA domain-containing protein [Bacteroidales bacterium]|nr:PEGA domain-containing protein [Bacteroidales bacterium]
MFRKVLLLVFAIVLSLQLFAQLEVKEGSFKEVAGFVNINTEKMYDDNDKPYAVLKVRTENINDRQRRELNFGGDAQTFFEIEYKDGEVWLYISYYATFLKISHPDISSTEFYIPFDMEPKKGYEMTLVNKPAVDEEIIKRLEKLENATNAVIVEQAIEKPVEKLEEKQQDVGFITVKTTPKGAFVLVDNKIVGMTPYLSEAVSVGNHKISVSLEGYEPDAQRVVIYKDTEVKIEFDLNMEKADKQEVAEEKLKIIDTVTVKDGVFSVSQNNAVYFSKGNIQYNDSTQTWHFAENQWDVVEESWNDLFEWEDFITKIEDKEWRTLTKDEWDYLLNKRKTKSGVRYAKAVVNGVNGVILLPDNWKGSYSLNNINDRGALYSGNRIKQSDWERRFEANGAVFLSASGYQHGHVFRVGSAGRYWSSTKESGNNAYCVSFTINELEINTDNCKHGLSVRLVRDVE